MDEIIAFTERSIPVDVLLPSLGVTCVVFVVLFATRIRCLWRWVMGVLLTEYVFLVLWSTVIKRIGTEKCDVKLMPYWNAEDLLSGKDPMDWLEMGLNILLFVPIGIMMTGICLHRRLWKIVLSGCIMSVAIELLQLTFQCGLCETNDVIHNTIGCAIGACVVKIIYRNNMIVGKFRQ